MNKALRMRLLKLIYFFQNHLIFICEIYWYISVDAYETQHHTPLNMSIMTPKPVYVYYYYYYCIILSLLMDSLQQLTAFVWMLMCRIICNFRTMTK